MRRDALISLALLMGVVTVLALVFWVARGWPDLPECVEDLTPAQDREVDAFRSAHSPIHIGAGVVLAGAVWLLAAARRGRRVPGLPTLVGLAVALLLLAAPLTGAVDADDRFVPIALSFVALPATALLLVLALTLLVREQSARLGAHVALATLWLSLAVLLPAHYALVGTVDESWCITGLG